MTNYEIKLLRLSGALPDTPKFEPVQHLHIEEIAEGEAPEIHNVSGSRHQYVYGTVRRPRAYPHVYFSFVSPHIPTARM